MNIFKRELILYFRSKLFYILTPCFVLIPSLWYFVILKSFENNILDIEAFYNIYPVLLSLVIPLITQGLWLREKQNGLDGIIIQSSIRSEVVVIEKIKASFFIVTIFIIISLPIIFVLSFLGYIDLGQLLMINIGLLLFSLFAIALGFFLSTIINSKIVCYFLTMLLLLILTTIRSYSVLGFISIESRLKYFFNGILDIGSLFFFLSISLLFIIIATSMIRRSLTLNSLVLCGVLTFACLIPGSMDMTMLRRYSLTQETIELLDSSEDNISVSYYYSEDLERKSNYVSDIKDYLKLYNRHRHCDVNILTDNVPEFQKYIGLYNPYPLDNDLYSFLVVENKKGKRIIPIVSYSEELEFNILKALDDIIFGKKSVVIMPGEEGYTEDSFTMLNQVLSSHFNVSYVFPGDEIPENTSSLILVGHYAVDYNALSQIGDFMSRGGNILIAGTGLPTEEALEYRDTPILDALKYCGVYIEPYLIGDNNNIGLIDDEGRVTPYPLNVVTSPVKGEYSPVVFPFNGFDALYLSPVNSESINFIPLLQSSNESWLVNIESGINGVPEGSYTAAVLGLGAFAHNFSGEQSSTENRIIVLGNSLSLTDLSHSFGIDNGYDFVLRSLYFLNGDEDKLYSKDKMLWEKTFYKVDSSIRFYLTKFLWILFVIIYPVTVLIICMKKRVK